MMTETDLGIVTDMVHQREEGIILRPLQEALTGQFMCHFWVGVHVYSGNKIPSILGKIL